MSYVLLILVLAFAYGFLTSRPRPAQAKTPEVVSFVAEVPVVEEPAAEPDRPVFVDQSYRDRQTLDPSNYRHTTQRARDAARQRLNSSGVSNVRETGTSVQDYRDLETLHPSNYRYTTQSARDSARRRLTERGIPHSRRA